MLILQMFAAPLQAGFSDFYFRKKGLLVALTCSLLSLLLISFFNAPGVLAIIFICTGLLINSFLGNIIPITWSALADEQKKNLRFSLALTTSAYAIGYIILALLIEAPSTVANIWLWEDVILPSILLVVSFILVWKFFRDASDKRALNGNTKQRFSELVRTEISALAKELKSTTTRLGLSAYFLWAASQYSTLLTLVNSPKYATTVIIMMFGYFAGVTILGFCKKIRDEKIIKTAFIVTISSMSLFFVSSYFVKIDFFLLSFCFFFYTLGNAFLTPSIFSLFSKEREIHQQGKGFGLIVAADSAGFLVGVMAEMGFNYSRLDLQYLILFSFLIFGLSWFPYSGYEKKRKNASRITDHTNQ
jgi:MFS family permease